MTNKVANCIDPDLRIINIGFSEEFDQQKWLGNQLKVIDASAVYMYLLNPRKLTKKVTNRIGFDSRIMNIMFSKISDRQKRL